MSTTSISRQSITTSSNTTPTITTLGIHHIGLIVSKLELTVNFFTDCLQWTMAKETPDRPGTHITNGSVFLTLWQTENIHLSANHEAKVGLHHLCIKVASEQALFELFDRASIFPNVEVEFAPMYLKEKIAKRCMIFEPSGILIELLWEP